MFHSRLSSVYHTLELASLVVDGIRNDKFNRVFDPEHYVVSVNSLEKIIHNLRYNWCSSNIFIFDVQIGLLFISIQQRCRFLKMMNYNVSIIYALN
jgi:hypothetical protein